LENPWLSVIVPTYNGASYLDEALESVVIQNDDQVEVIVVDDGSTDQTLQIVESYLNRLQLRIVSGPHRGNWVAATNKGMALARGAYSCWLHQDDAWDAARLQVLRVLTARHPDAELFIHPVWFMDDRSRKVGRWSCPFSARQETLIPTQFVERLLVQDFLASTAPVFKTNALARSGPLDEQLWFTADWDFWLKLGASGMIVYHPAPLSSFRVHRDSQTMRRIEQFGSQYSTVLDRHLVRWEGILPDLARISRAARFSADVNVAFARWASGQPAGLLRLAWRFVELGPRGWQRYLRDSRITERVVGRLRAGVLAPTGKTVQKPSLAGSGKP
jgi:GT2 family glycosyltransferase